MSITTIVIDDEKPARDELTYLLKGFPEINVIGQTLFFSTSRCLASTASASSKSSWNAR